MLHPYLGGDTVANNAVLNGRKRVADALVRNALSRTGVPVNAGAGLLDRQATLQALTRLKSAAPPRARERPVRFAHYEGFMDPDMPPWALDRGFAGPVTPRYRNLDEMLDQTHNDLLNNDHLGVLRDHQSNRFGSRNGQVDEAMGPLDLLGSASSVLRSGTRALKSRVGTPREGAFKPADRHLNGDVARPDIVFQSAPDFVVNPRGVNLPVPQGANPMPTPVLNEMQNQTGTAFTGGTIRSSRGADKTVDLRMMNSTQPRGRSPGYLRGYSAYTTPKSSLGGSQSVDPYSGKTLERKHPWAHIPN